MFDKLLQILNQNAESGAIAWLESTVAEQRAAFQQRPFYFAFSGVSRRFDRKGRLAVSEADLASMAEEVPGFTIAGWDQFRLARVLLLLLLAKQSAETYRDTLESLLGSADLREQTAIFSAFPLLPDPEFLVPMAREGLRTNIVDVFDAIALNNPFPARHFPEAAWNQLVLKALFIHRPLYRIHGIDKRANSALAGALSNLAHERWAAGRPVSPELWRCCASFLNKTIIDDIGHVAGTDEPGQREAVALLVAADKEGVLSFLRDSVPHLLDDVAGGRLTWKSLGKQLASS